MCGNIFFVQPSEITEEEVYSCKNVYLSGWTFNNINPLGLFEKDIFFDKEIEKKSYDLLFNNLRFSNEVLKAVEAEHKT